MVLSGMRELLKATKPADFSVGFAFSFNKCK